MMVAAGIMAGTTALPMTALAADTFGVVSDTHARAEGDNYDVTTNADTARAFNWVKQRSNLKGVIIAGDLGDRGTVADFGMFNSLWNNSGIRVPRVIVMGNHDSSPNLILD